MASRLASTQARTSSPVRSPSKFNKTLPASPSRPAAARQSSFPAASSTIVGLDVAAFRAERLKAEQEAQALANQIALLQRKERKSNMKIVEKQHTIAAIVESVSTLEVKFKEVWSTTNDWNTESRKQ